MGITGNLKTMVLSDIFQWLANGRVTGTLVVSNGEVVKSIYFRDGAIVSCNSTDPREFLGHFLVSHGCIGEHELAAAVGEQDRSGEMMGKILVDQGAVSEAELQRMLALKAEESIFELFLWEGGQFRFLDDQLPAYELVPISLNVTSVTLEGIRRVDEWARIRRFIPSAQCVPVAVRDLLEGETDEARRNVLEQVNDDRTVEEICLQTHSSEYFVSEILFQKAAGGRLKLVRPRVVATPAAAPGTAAAELLAEARARLKELDVEQALRRLRAAGSLQPDDRELGREIKAVESEIRAKLQEAGVERGGVPVLAGKPAALGGMSLTPEEGFILSRIGGGSDLGSILKISPLPELEALVVFWKLVKAGLVAIRYQ
jgi:hypothetical protein